MRRSQAYPVKPLAVAMVFCLMLVVAGPGAAGQGFRAGPGVSARVPARPGARNILGSPGRWPVASSRRQDDELELARTPRLEPSRSRPFAAAAAVQGADNAAKSRQTLDRLFDNTGKILAALPRGVSMRWVSQMRRKSRALPPDVKRLQDALQGSGFRAVALNRRVVDQHNDNYTAVIPGGRVTDQKQSGRCWIFGALNMIRSTLLAEGRKLPKAFEFSENYLYFFSMLEKSNHYLERAIDLLLAKRVGFPIPALVLRDRLVEYLEFGDGGYFSYFQFLVSKYGLVPKSAMRETVASGATDTLKGELASALAAATAEIMRAGGKNARYAARRALRAKSAAMDKAWKILAAHLGIPPTDFDYRDNVLKSGKKPLKRFNAEIVRYTPREFAARFAAVNPDDYVVLSHYSRKKRGAVYQVMNSAIGASARGKPDYDTRFMNVEPRRLEELAAASIESGFPVYFAADVTKNIDIATGIMHPRIYERDPVYGFDRGDQNRKPSRNILTYLLLSAPNHAMLLTGYDRPDPKGPIVKFRVENSWGPKAGDKGFLHMYADWFRDNVYEIVVHKKFLNAVEKKAWDGKPRIINANEEF